ncbi:hypothetical protein Z043_106538 [Scleropages formosus]|uniref:Transposase Tc1-like domain-containing protein n=1 Tax=Scleropages formosus TaxID=113540 RepID=A0A0P7UJ20_SCLFO|nr:hypothetical protein Z043_106538 [Scleropages formosus]
MGKCNDLRDFDKAQIVMARQLGRSIFKQQVLLGVPSMQRATQAQIAENLNVGHDRKVSENTVHHSLLHMGLRSLRLVRAPMLTSVHC